MLISLGSADVSRVTESAFLSMSRGDQKKYLERFPKSRHRFLIKSKDKKKGRKLNKEEFDSMSDSHKKSYIDRNPKSKHKPKERKGKKIKREADHSTKAENTKKHKKAKRERGKKKAEQRDTLNVAGVGAISKNQLTTLPAIKQQHLHKAAANIEENRETIHETINEQLKDRPEFKQDGLAGVRAFLNGDDKYNAAYDDAEDAAYDDAEDADFTEEDYQSDSEEQPKKKNKKNKKNKKKGLFKTLKNKFKHKDGHAMLNLIVKATILAGGVGLMAVGAGPLALVVGRGLIDLAEDFRGIASEQDDADTKTIDDVIDLVVTYLRNVDAKDLTSITEKTFAAVASSDEYSEYSFTVDCDADEDVVRSVICKALEDGKVTFDSDEEGNIISSAGDLIINIGYDAGTQIGSGNNQISGDPAYDSSVQRSHTLNIETLRKRSRR